MSRNPLSDLFDNPEDCDEESDTLDSQFDDIDSSDAGSFDFDQD